MRSRSSSARRSSRGSLGAGGGRLLVRRVARRDPAPQAVVLSSRLSPWHGSSRRPLTGRERDERGERAAQTTRVTLSALLVACVGRRTIPHNEKVALPAPPRSRGGREGSIQVCSDRGEVGVTRSLAGVSARIAAATSARDFGRRGRFFPDFFG